MWVQCSLRRPLWKQDTRPEQEPVKVNSNKAPFSHFAKLLNLTWRNVIPQDKMFYSNDDYLHLGYTVTWLWHWQPSLFLFLNINISVQHLFSLQFQKKPAPWTHLLDTGIFPVSMYKIKVKVSPRLSLCSPSSAQLLTRNPNPTQIPTCLNTLQKACLLSSVPQRLGWYKKHNRLSTNREIY